MRESEFEKEFIGELKRLPNSWWSPKLQAMVRGFPDRIGAINGRFVAIEFKKSASEMHRSKGRIALQKLTLEEMREGGIKTFFACPENKDEVILSIMELCLCE